MGEEKTHLEKAQGALSAAGAMEVELGQKHLPDGFKDLILIATVQSSVSQAESLERIAEALETMNRKNSHVGRGHG